MISSLQREVLQESFTLEEKVAFLKSPAPYHSIATEIVARETHMSWVFFVGDYVFKLKKPVKYRYLDHRTLSSRFRDCRREIVLNKKLAEDIYIGLVPLTVDARGKLQLSGNGPIQDWLVKMKRIPEDLMLDNAIKNDNIDLSRLTEAAKLLARFYQASAYIPTTYSTYQKKMEKEIISTYKQLRHNDFQLPKRTIEKLINRLLNFLDTQGKLLEERLVHQRIIEAHGDLRPEHVCLLPKPVIIDRLEFSHALRVLDTAEELSYFSMECEIAGNALPGKIFLNTYSNLTKDNINEKVILFYKLKRACLRAYLIARHITEESYRNSDHWLSMANRYLVLAKHYDQMLS